MERRRVVITGMGTLCPTGNTVEEAWRNAAEGNTGIDTMQRVDTSRLATHIAGEVKNFDPAEVLGRREARRADRVTQLAMAATMQAMADSGLDVTDENSYDIGCIVGSGVGGIETIVNSVHALEARGHKGVSPLAVPMMLIDGSSGKISIEYGLRGPNFNLTTACATGNDCIGTATEYIRRGKLKAVVTGSTESAFVEVAIASFNNMTALSKRNDDPKHASRPFDAERDGFIMSEGAGILILEDLEYALERGATIYAEVLGYGHTSDAYHVTAPMESGEGAVRAIELALEDANMTAEDIDYINAHGTSTPLNDKSETIAIKKALGERAYEIPVSSTKSVTGHMLGAAGSVEAIFSVQAMREGFIPPTVNLENPDPDCDLNYVPNKGIKQEVNVVMSNAFGFGGHNAVIIMGKYGANGHA